MKQLNNAYMNEPTDLLVSNRMRQLIQFYGRDEIKSFLVQGIDPMNSMLETHLSNLKQFNNESFQAVTRIIFPEMFPSKKKVS